MITIYFFRSAYLCYTKCCHEVLLLDHSKHMCACHAHHPSTTTTTTVAYPGRTYLVDLTVECRGGYSQYSLEATSSYSIAHLMLIVG